MLDAFRSDKRPLFIVQRVKIAKIIKQNKLQKSQKSLKSTSKNRVPGREAVAIVMGSRRCRDGVAMSMSRRGRDVYVAITTRSLSDFQINLNKVEAGRVAQVSRREVCLCEAS